MTVRFYLSVDPEITFWRENAKISANIRDDDTVVNTQRYQKCKPLVVYLEINTWPQLNWALNFNCL